MKPLIIYHFPCDDGFASALVAWLKFGDSVEYCPRDHNDPIETLPDVKGREVYIIDFSFKKEVMTRICEEAINVVWLDHHKTAFELAKGEDYLTPTRQRYEWSHRNGDDFYNIQEMTIVLDNQKSGCILAWEYFFPGEPVPQMLKFIDDIDRWVHEVPGSIAFSHFLRSHEFDFNVWHSILLLEANSKQLRWALNAGHTIERNFNKMAKDIYCQGRQQAKFSYIVADSIIRTATGLACNAPAAFASDVGAMLAIESGTFGMTWYQRADLSVSCSLRSQGDFDVSAIAKSMGGGGHKNAAGFTATLNDIQSLVTNSK